MKSQIFQWASFNNRKKQLRVVYTSKKTIILHYSWLGIRSNIERVWVDSETRGRSIGIKLSDGKVDYLPYDQPLALGEDSEFLLQNQMEVLTARIKEVISKKKISKRYLAQQLRTSDNQIQRLLNPKIINKNLTQLYHIATLLGLDLEISLKKAA